MKVSVHQPNYLPYLGFFEKMAKSDIFILYDNTQFKSGDFQHRNRIRTSGPQGWIWLSVPTSRKFGTQINEVLVADQMFRKKHWKSIEYNYQRSPFFADYAAAYADLYTKQWTRLVDLNISLIRQLSKDLGIRAQLVTSSELLPDLSSKSTQALVDLCRATGANHYISGADGEKYLDLATFEQAEVSVEFQCYTHPNYPQAHPGFQPFMSAIDLLFNCGESAQGILLNDSVMPPPTS